MINITTETKMRIEISEDEVFEALKRYIQVRKNITLPEGVSWVTQYSSDKKFVITLYPKEPNSIVGYIK